MPRFFVETLEGDVLAVLGADARHIALSLRMAAGEEVILCDGRGQECRCTLTEVSPQEALCRVEERRESRAEPRAQITLYQALPKGDKLEWIVQKAVELGAAEIVPVLTSRCISRPDEKSMLKKRERLQKIADAAAAQSGRGRLPAVGPLRSFSQALGEASRAALPLFCYEGGGIPLREAMRRYQGGAISLLIGAEGGFSPEEARQAAEAGLCAVSLGPRILRCETAPLAAIAAILYAAGDME